MDFKPHNPYTIHTQINLINLLLLQLLHNPYSFTHRIYIFIYIVVLLSFVYVCMLCMDSYIPYNLLQNKKKKLFYFIF